MPYCTQADIENKLPPSQVIELTDDDSLGVLDFTVLNAVIAEADELIDSHVGEVYAVPFSTVPGIIKNLSVSISIWKLHERRGLDDDVRRRAYEDAVKLLEKLAKGMITLGEEEATAATETTEAQPASSTEGVDRVFDKSTLEDF